MAKLPDSAQLGYSVPQTKTPRFQRRASLVNEAIGDLAGTVEKLVYQHQEKEDAFSYAQAKSKHAQADVDARKEVEAWYEAERAKSPEPEFFSIPKEDLEKRYAESMRKAGEESAGLIRTKRDRALFELDTKAGVTAGSGKVLEFGKQMEVRAGRASLDAMLDSNRTIALEAPDALTRERIIDNVNDGIQGAVRRGFISGPEAVQQGQAWTLSFAEGYIDTQSTEKQIEILSNPEGTPAKLLPPDRRAVLLTQAKNQLRIQQDRAEADKKSKMVEVRQALMDQLRDNEAGAMYGETSDIPSLAVLKTALGDREGERAYEAAKLTQQVGASVAGFHQMSTGDIVNTVESYRPDKNAKAGMADQAPLYRGISSGAQNIFEARQKDPAGYLTQYAPASQNAWKVFQATGTEEARDAYLSAIDADRERLGLPKGDVLPNTYAKALAAEISSQKSPEKLAQMLGAESQKWGERWGDVHAQVAKDLPDVAAVIGSGIDPAAANLLAGTMNLKESDLQEMLPAGMTMGALKDTVDRTFGSVRRSFPIQGARTWNAIHDSAVRLSLAHMQAGDEPSNAVTRAYKELIADQYNVGEVRNVTFLVPKNFNIDVIQEEAQHILDNPPKSLVNGDPRAEKAFRKDAYFVIGERGDGLRLYLGASPTRVTYTFKELEDVRAQRNAIESDETERLRDEAMKARGR